jgi:hypothetical protein
LSLNVNDRKRCIFIKEWKCNIETDEIPLDVCRLCVEARKLHTMEARKITLSTKTAERAVFFRKKLQKLSQESAHAHETPRFVTPERFGRLGSQSRNSGRS